MKTLHIGSVSKKGGAADVVKRPVNEDKIEFVLNDATGIALKLIIFGLYASLFYALYQ